MRRHQKYLALEDADGRLAPHFLVVANMPAADGGKAIVAGNERVLRARLWDAQFFWDQDTQAAAREPRAGARRRGLPRPARLARRQGRAPAEPGDLARRSACPARRVDQAARAAQLCKADLVTGMVGEFPELQGVMGRYYALPRRRARRGRRGDRRALRAAGAGRRCPTAPVSVTVGARRPARHAGRLLRGRREADRLEGPLRAAPGGARRDPADPREPAAAAAARGVPRRARGLWRPARQRSTPNQVGGELLASSPTGCACISRTPACATT